MASLSVEVGLVDADGDGSLLSREEGDDILLGRDATLDEDGVLIVRQPTGTMASAIFNLANSTIGAGVLGLPFVLKVNGLGAGVILIIMGAIFADITLRLLHLDNLLSRATTYEGIGFKLFGSWGAVVVKICVLVINFGAIVSYNIVLGDLLSQLMEDFFCDQDNGSSSSSGMMSMDGDGSASVGGNSTAFAAFDGVLALDDSTSLDLGPQCVKVITNRAFIMFLVNVFFLLPLSLPKNISSLQYGSILSLIFVLCFSVVVIFRMTTDGLNQPPVWFSVDLGLFNTIGVVIFAFSCHTGLNPISAEMKDNSMKNMSRAVHCSVTICVISFLLVAVCGYLTFYGATLGNVLLNYPTNDPLVDVFRGLLSLSIILTFPLALYPARLSFDNLLFPTEDKETVHASDSYEKLDDEIESSDPLSLDGDALEPDLSEETEIASSQLRRRQPACVRASRDCVQAMLDRVQSVRAHCTGDEQVPICCNRFLVSKASIRFVAETLFLLIMALTVAILVPSLSDVFNLVGGVASSFTSYILPGLFYWRLQHLDSGNYYYLLFKKYSATFFMAIGSICAVMVPTVTFLTMIGVVDFT